MKPATETATYEVNMNSLTDATDLESYGREWRVSTNPVPSGVSMAGQMSPKTPVLQFHGFFGTVVGTLMDPAGTIMGVPAPEAASQKHPTYAKWIQAATAQVCCEHLVDSTIPQERPEEIEGLIDTLFEAAKDEYFEDGMESRFSNHLLSLVRKYGNWAMQEIAYLIIYERANPEVSSEALRWLGGMGHPATHAYRLWLLERSLSCSSARVRDAAALGLASMGEPHAIPFLEQAIAREKCIELRENLEQVLQEL